MLLHNPARKFFTVSFAEYFAILLAVVFIIGNLYFCIILLERKGCDQIKIQ